MRDSWVNAAGDRARASSRRHFAGPGPGNDRSFAPVFVLRFLRRHRLAAGRADVARGHRLAHHEHPRSARQRPRADADRLRRLPVPREPGRCLGLRVPAHRRLPVRGDGADAAAHLRGLEHLGLRREHAGPERSAHAAGEFDRLRLDLPDAIGCRPRHRRQQDRRRGAEGRRRPADGVVAGRISPESQLDRHRRAGDGRPRDAGRGRAGGELAFPRTSESGQAEGHHRADPGWNVARRIALRGLRARLCAAVLAGHAPGRIGLHRHRPAARLREVLPLCRDPRRPEAGDPSLRRLHALAGADGGADQPIRGVAIRRSLRRGGRAALSQRRRTRELLAGALVRRLRVHRL